MVLHLYGSSRTDRLGMSIYGKLASYVANANLSHLD